MAEGVQYEDVGRVLIVHLREGFDPHEPEELWSELKKQIEAGYKNFVVAMAEGMTMPSLFIGGLIALSRDLREFSGKIVMTGVSDQYLRVMQISRITTMVPVEPDVRAAVVAASSASQ